MRITPGESWTWSYKSIDDGNYLGLIITSDDGNRYFFRTNFKVQKLAVFPENGAPFCVLDAQLLNDFMSGLNEIGVYDNESEQDVSINMELALNAVACNRFVAAPRRVIEHAFIPYMGNIEHINRGQVVSLYTKDKKVCDFIALDGDNEAVDGAYRLMFVNRELKIGKQILCVGALIKVPRTLICPFRALSKSIDNMGYA